MEATEQLATSDVRKSKYNDALATLMRINEIWKRAYSHALAGHLQKWNSDLDAIWRELSEDVAEKSDEEKNYKEINKKIVNGGLFNLRSANTDGFNPNPDDKSNRLKISELIQEKEVFLRRLKNKQGKGTVYEESVEEYMDRME